MAWVSSRANPCPGAGVRAVAEAELTGGVAPDVERVGSFPFAFVAVGRGVDDQDPCAGRESGVPAMLGVADARGGRTRAAATRSG